MNVVMISILAGMYGLSVTVVRAIATDQGANKLADVTTTLLSGNVVVFLFAFLFGIVLWGG